MNLYLLKVIGQLVNPWDCAFGFVVRASSPKKAREMASGKCGDEGKDFWLDPGRSSCQLLKVEGDAEIILRDFNAG